MRDVVKSALATGAVAGGGIFFIAALAAVIFAPVLIAAAWYTGRLSFEAAVIGLLLLAVYLGGGSSD